MKQLASHLGLHVPVMNELHARVEIKDPLHIIPEKSPFLIWSDAIQLPWTKEEKEKIISCLPAKEATHLLNPIPVPGIAGAHLRPLSIQECHNAR